MPSNIDFENIFSDEENRIIFSIIFVSIAISSISVLFLIELFKDNFITNFR